MGFPGQCNKQDWDDNEKLSLQADPHRRYWAVEVLNIVAVDAGTWTVTIRAHDVDGVARDFHLAWRDLNVVWPYCPSTVPSRSSYPNPGLPDTNTGGVLFIQETFLTTNRILGGTPKFPKALPGSPFKAKLRVLPQSLVLTAIELAPNDQVKQGTVDLMNRLHAPAQPIEVGPGPMEIELTEKGFGRFGVTFPASRHLKAAVEIIEERKDPRAIAEAWGIVDQCKSLLDAGRWGLSPEKSHRGVQPTEEEAWALIQRVLAT